MVRTLPYGPEGRLNPARISGIAAAMLVHALAFLLLLIPATLPPLATQLADDKPQIEIINKPIEVPITPPQEQHHPTPVERHTVTPTPIATPRPIDIPIETSQVSDEPAPPVIADPAPADTSPTIAPPSGPISASYLAYVQAPAPSYPRSAITSHAEGTVMLKVLVDVDGTPLEVVIETSSGNKDLDRAARQQVLKHWRFQPAMQDGRAVQAYGRVPVEFSLQ